MRISLFQINIFQQFVHLNTNPKTFMILSRNDKVQQKLGPCLSEVNEKFL